MFNRDPSGRSKIRKLACGSILVLLASCGKDTPGYDDIVQTVDTSSTTATTLPETTTHEGRSYGYLIDEEVCPEAFNGQIWFNLDGSYVHVTPDGKPHTGVNSEPFTSEAAGIAVFCATYGE